MADDSLCYFEEDPVSNPSLTAASTSMFEDVLAESVTRRQSMGRLAGWFGLTTLGIAAQGEAASKLGQPGLTFPELNRGLDTTARVADGYRLNVLLA